MGPGECHEIQPGEVQDLAPEMRQPGIIAAGEEDQDQDQDQPCPEGLRTAAGCKMGHEPIMY